MSPHIGIAKSGVRVMKRQRIQWACVGVLIALLLGQGRGAASGDQAGTTMPAQAGSTVPAQVGTPREAPVVRFDPQGIDLAGAVRLTLQNSPDIQIAETFAIQQFGFAQQQRGAFDTIFAGNTSYNYQRQQLTPTAQLSENLKRQTLRTARAEQNITVTNLQSLATQLQVIRQTSPASSAQLIQLIRGLDAPTASDLQVIDALYNSKTAAADPSLLSDLQTHRNQLIDDTIKRAQSGVASAQGAINQLDTLITNLGGAPTQEFFNNGVANVSVSRLFRNGIFFSPFFNGTSNGSNFIDKPFSSDFGGKGIFPLYNFQSGFHATVPFARGLGAAATAAPERSSRINEQAARLDAQHQASTSALSTINAYWNLRGAQEGVGIAQQSVDRQGRIVQLTRATIAAGDLPQVELARVQASEARSQAQLRDAQRALLQARVALATAMGVAITTDEATLPQASDPFPPPPDPAAVDEQRVAALATAGIQQRRDVTAAQRRVDAALVLMRGAELNQKLRVDLNGGSWWTGNDEAIVKRALSRWVGPSYHLGLDVEKPFGNNFLRGLYVEAQAGSASSQIMSGDLQRQIRLSVVRTARSLNEAIQRVRQAQAAVNFYQQTVDAEISRFQIGEVTLIDTITTEAQQADARRALVAAQQDLAQLIAELRFQTGTLVSDANAPVTPQGLVTVP
jgi:outer membrane protein TolC